MTTQATDTSVRTAIEVQAPVERAFRVFTDWDVSLRWELETDPRKTSEVEVRFTALAADRTRVELEHRHLDRHGEGWEQMRDAVGSPGGWPAGMTAFARRTEQSAPDR